MPADALTKALSPAKFGSMLALLNLGLPPMPDRVSSLSWSRGILAVLVLGLSLTLKGQDRTSGSHVPEEQTDPHFWKWLVCMVVIVILAWEGVKALIRACLGYQRRVATGREPTGELEEGGAPTQEGTYPSGENPIDPLPEQVTERPPRRQAINRGQGSRPPTYVPRVPHNLEAFFTAHGERWHQDASCPDIRTRITQRFLPCGRCTAGRPLMQPNPTPLVIPEHNPPPPPVRRRRP